MRGAEGIDYEQSKDFKQYTSIINSYTGTILNY